MVNDMGCSGCGKETKRSKPTVMVGNIDEEPKVVVEAKQGSFRPQLKDKTPEAEVAPAPTSPQQNIFDEVKELTFDDLMSRAGQHQKHAAIEIEKAFSQMSEAMRHFHILNLLSIANFENLSATGLSPDQAVVALKTALDRKDFSEINKLYPNLRSQVGHRYEELIDKKITL